MGLANTGSRGPFEVKGFCDANWAGWKQDCKSTSGYVITVSGAIVKWKSMKKLVLTTSTVDTDYVALGSLPLEGLWLACLISFATGIASGFQIPLKIWNQAEFKLARNYASENRTRHVDR